LASPAKRDDSSDSMKVVDKKLGTTTTSKSHSGKDPSRWYMPATNDSRRDGARRRSYNSHWSKESASSSERNIWKSPGLKSLSRGIYENLEPSYRDDDEQEVLRLNFEVKKLIKDMESKE